MTREEAEEHAKDMTYRDAVYNALQGKCIPYRKATLIKLYELLDKLEQEPCDTCEHSDEIDGSNCYECVKGIRGRYNPQPKTGHWIEPTSDMIHNHICGNCEVICSSCNENAIDEYDY